MPETALQLTYEELQKQVAYFLFGTRRLRAINADDAENLQAVVNNGLRRFYYPAQVDPTLAHDWSFLVGDFTFITEVGTQDYLMPFNFGGAIGPLHHDPGDNIKVSVVKVTPNKLLWQRQLNVTITNWPTMYAERPVPQGGATAQRWKIMLWPSPSAVYTLHGSMRVLPLGPNGAQEYLYGGPEHSQTILESCLAQAELQLDGAPGAHAAAFRNCLLTSIILDQQMHAPEVLGYNANDNFNNGGAILRPDGQFFENFSQVTYNNSAYTG
ncbi:MAG: hypothetical protein ACYCQK_01435 [Acidiferrobacteraceae bacterium]